MNSICCSTAKRLATALLLFHTIVWPHGQTMKYTYDTAGRLLQVDFGNGQRIEYVYDRNGNLLSRSTVSFTDSDNDRLDDGWETKHFGDLSRNGLSDSDADGQSDLREFLSGTNPSDPKSVLQIIRSPEVAQGTVRIVWQAEPGRRYRVEYKKRIDSLDWVQLAGEVIPQGTTGTATAPVSSEEEQRFYRVVLIP